MRPTPWIEAEKYRMCIPGIAWHRYGDDFGRFIIPHGSSQLTVIVSAAYGKNGWDHVSVSMANRCPNWPEMCFVKALFFRDDETVIQFHPPADLHVNCHPYCLHLWRPAGLTIPTPPRWMIGPVKGELVE